MEAKPKRTPFLTADWNNLVVINYEVDPAVLEPLVPKGTELDPFQGKHFVSVVGFLFRQTKFLGLVPIYPFHTFEEINLRFYIRRKVGSTIRRAVCFVREVVPYPAVAWVARTLYNEPYCSYPTSHRWLWLNHDDTALGGRFLYKWTVAGQECCLEATTTGALCPLHEGSFESFILEHYWGYTKQKNGGTKEYQVWHPSWEYWAVERCSFSADVEKLYGKNFVIPLRATPHSAFVAKGSQVGVYRGERILPSDS